MMMQTDKARRDAKCSSGNNRGRAAIAVKSEAAKTANMASVLFFYVVLLTFWVVAPCKAENSTTMTYNTIGQISSKQTSMSKEVYSAPATTTVFSTYNSTGQLISRQTIETTATPDDGGVSRNSYFAGRTLNETDLSAEQKD